MTYRKIGEKFSISDKANNKVVNVVEIETLQLKQDSEESRISL